MDVDMDIDLGPIEGAESLEMVPVRDQLTEIRSDFSIQPIEPINQVQREEALTETSANVQPTTPHKVHVRGLDDLTTGDIEAFSTEHFPSNPPTRIEWIDDTSANIVFDTPATGLAALQNLAPQESDSFPTFQLRSAKAYSARPEVALQVRIAMASDQKPARAHEASRFYLMHPEHDPREQRRRDRGSKGEDGEYRRRRYGDDENKRRRRKDRADGFDASMYDDHESTSRRSSVASSSEGRSRRRIDSYRPNSSGARDRSASPGSIIERRRKRTPPPSYRPRDPFPFPLENEGKELFPSKHQENGQIASGSLLSGRTASSDPKKDLFPLKSSSVLHRRSDAFDAADETADLFAGRMSVPFGQSPKNGKALADRITSAKSGVGRLKDTASDHRIEGLNGMEDDGLSIRGASRADQGIIIRGGAASNGASIGKIRELFPDKSVGNAGKELFAEKLQGRGGRRNKAEDMFS